MQLWWWNFILLFELNLFCSTLRCNSGDGILYCSFYLNLFFYTMMKLWCWNFTLLCLRARFVFILFFLSQFVLSYTKMQLWWWDFILLFELNLICPTLRCNSGDGSLYCSLNSICFVPHLDATLVMGFYTAFWTQFVLSYTQMQLWWWEFMLILNSICFVLH